MRLAGSTFECRLKHVATINDETLPDDTPSDFELRYVDINNVDSSGVLHEVRPYCFDDAPSRARRRVRHGDVIISTVRTYLQAIAPIRNPPHNMIVSTGFAVIRPRVDVLDPRFCMYALRDPSFLAEVERRSVGVSYPAITASDLGNIPLLLPTLGRQRAIAENLDRETRRLDGLVAQKERILRLLDEKRRAVITRLVTRGSNPDVHVRDSGIPWLGRIPAHWEVERARWLFRERDERTSTGEERLLTVSHLTGVTPRSEKDVNMFMAETMEGYKMVSAGDLVINTLWAWMGAMGVSPVNGIVSPAYNVYRPNERFDAGYVDALVRSPLFAQEVARYSKGVWSSRLRLYPEEFFSVALPVPPRGEQARIVAALDREMGTIGDLRIATKKTAALLKERRAALIAAAVTGQLDIGSVE